MRMTYSLLILGSGVALGFVSYFALAARLGTPTHEGFSNPRVDFAPSLLVLAVVLVFVAAVVYELLPDKKDQ